MVDQQMAEVIENGRISPKINGAAKMEPEDKGGENLLNVPETEIRNRMMRNGSLTSHSDTTSGLKPELRYREDDLDSSSYGADDDQEDVQDDDDDDDDDDSSEVEAVPDGGWGWVVCFGSFAITFILDGTLFSFGVLMLALVSDLGQDKSTTSWIGSAQMGLHMIMGPAISVMLQKFTIRQVILIGSVISFCAFFVSVFSPNVYILIVTYGILGGMGFGMVFLPAVIGLVPYFNTKRAIATGIATSGSGLGMFAYGWITDKLLEAYNWRGTILILSGLLLNFLICGLLFRPLATNKSKKNNRLQGEDYTSKYQDEEDEHKKLLEARRSEPEEHFSPRNGVHEVIPEVPSPEKTQNGFLGSAVLEKTSNGPQMANEKASYDLVLSSRSFHEMSSAVRTAEDQPQARCDVKSPAVVVGGNGANFSSNENEVLRDVSSHCAAGEKFVKESGAPNGINPDVPIIINTPPSPAILQPSNRHSLDCAQLINAQNTSGNRTSNISSLSESNIKDKCKHIPPQDSLAASVSFPTKNNSGEALIVSDANNIAIIIPTSDECVNRTPTGQYSSSPTCLVNSNVPSGTEQGACDTNKCNLTQVDTNSANLHSRNPLDSESIGNSNPDSNLNLNPTSGCDTSNIDSHNNKTLEVDSGFNSQYKNNNNINSNNNNNNSSNTDRERIIDVSGASNENKGSDIDISNSQPRCEQSPPLHLRPFWRVQEPSAGKFKVARIYNSDDHINSIKSALTTDSRGNSNSHRHGDHAARSSNGHLHARRKAQPPQQTLSPLAAMDLGKSQTVSLYGINGYRSQHPHHDHQHIRRRHHHHHHHHHSFYELGGSRVEIIDNLSNGGPSRMRRGSSTHLAAYHYFGSMASFGAAVTRSSSAENVDVIRVGTHKKSSHSCHKVLSRWFPTRLLKDPLFLLLLMGFVMWTGQSITMTYLPTYAVSLGLERSEAAYLISIIGIVNVIGRPIAGLITDCLPIPSIWLYMCALLLAAVTNFAIPMCKSYNLLAACAAVFGLCMAVAVSMRTIVLVDQMGLDALTESFGIVALFQGIAFIIIPPIAGSMIDEFKSSKPTFWMSAVMYTFSAAMMLAVICLGRKRVRAENEVALQADV